MIMGASQELLDFVYGIAPKDLPATTVHAAKRTLIDQIGVQLACSTLPWSQSLYRFAKSQSGTGKCTVVGLNDHLRAPWAAFANGSFGHGFEIDDIDLHADVHPGCYVIPTALAVAEEVEANGADFLAAVVAGYEVAQRLGKAMAPGCIARGFHPTAITGPASCAVVAGKLLGLNRDEFGHAFAIACGFAGGTMEYTLSGGSMKRMNGGKSALAGIHACLMAREGITGPKTMVEGPKGILKPFSDTVHIERVTADLGAPYRVEEMGFKPHACCVAIHPALDAIDKIKSQESFDGSEVASVRVGSNVDAVKVTGIGPDISDLTGMQFSMHFNTALRLYRGTNDFLDYTLDTMKDPKISDLAHRVTFELDDEAQSVFPEKFIAKVSVKLRDGREFHERVDHAKGFPENPLSDSDLERKYYSLATVILAESRAQEILDKAWQVDQLPSVASLGHMLTKNN